MVKPLGQQFQLLLPDQLSPQGGFPLVLRFFQLAPCLEELRKQLDSHKPPLFNGANISETTQYVFGTLRNGSKNIVLLLLGNSQNEGLVHQLHNVKGSLEQ